jgi:epoxyqueuosine reductase
VRFSQELPPDFPFAPRAIFVDKDAPSLARAMFTMEPADYAAAFKGSAIKRAKLWMLQRNAAIVLANTAERELSPDPT